MNLFRSVAFLKFFLRVVVVLLVDCLLSPSDAADEEVCVFLCGRLSSIRDSRALSGAVMC